jgi:hypothetical protein
MNKLLGVAGLALAALGPGAGPASALWPHDGCSHYKYTITIYATPYNAFATYPCTKPLGMPGGYWGQGPWGGCGQGGCDGSDGFQGWCGGPAGCLGPVDVLGPRTPNCVKAAFACDRRGHEPWWGRFCHRKNDCSDGYPGGGWWGPGWAAGCDRGSDDGRSHRCKLFHHRQPQSPANYWGPAYFGVEADCPGCDDGGVTPIPAPAQPAPKTPAPAPKQTLVPTPDNGTSNLTTLDLDPITNAWPLPR